jgi:hypothetical protein
MIQLDFTPPDDATWDDWIQDGRAAVAKMLADLTGKHEINAAIYKRQRDRLLTAMHQSARAVTVTLAYRRAAEG